MSNICLLAESLMDEVSTKETIHVLMIIYFAPLIHTTDICSATDLSQNEQTPIPLLKLTVDGESHASLATIGSSRTATTLLIPHTLQHFR